MDLSLWQASSILLLMFTAGAMANAGRALLMRMAGKWFPRSRVLQLTKIQVKE